MFGTHRTHGLQYSRGCRQSRAVSTSFICTRPHYCTHHYYSLLLAASRAAYKGHLSVFCAVMDSVGVNTVNGLGCTPLHAAAGGGAVATLRKALDSGADVCARDAEGLTPLHRAVFAPQNCSEVISLLLKAGAPLEAVTNKAETALTLAVNNAQLAAINALSEAGAQHSYRIHWAAHNGHHVVCCKTSGVAASLGSSAVECGLWCPLLRACMHA